MRTGGLRSPAWLLAAVTLAWVVLQLAVLWPIGRYLTYDEAIYLSQVYPDAPSLGFSAPRSRGITWLLAPVTAFEPSVGVIRGYLLCVYGVLFYLAFRAWIPVIGQRAVVAAGVFASTWLALFYGTEIYPNLLVALGAVGATGWLAQHLRSGSSRALAFAAAATAFVTLIRPVDGTLLAAALAVGALCRRPRVVALRWTAVAAAVVVGWTPWVVEAYQRFGGLQRRVAQASDNVDKDRVGPFDVVREHLLLTDGPIRGTASDTSAGVAVVGLLGWLVLAAGVLAALWLGLRRPRRPELLAPAVAAVAFAAEYSFMTTVVTARFLLPCYALAAVCLVATAPWPAAARRPAQAYRLAVGVLLAGWLAWNVPIAAGVADTEVAKRHERELLGAAVRAQAQGRDCVLVGQGNFPEMAFAAGCYGVRFDPHAEALRVPRSHADATVYVVSRTPPTRCELLRGPGDLRMLDTPGGRQWWLFTPKHQ